MAVETNYNVKVQLDPTSFPTNNKVVIWDPDSGSFALTGSYGSGGGDQNLQEVTDIGNTTTTSSRFLFNQNHQYGNPLISQNATSGFYVDAADTQSLAYTYVTPQPPRGKVGILSIPLTAGGQVEAHPSNYITIGGVSISDGGDTTHDPPSACATKVSNISDSNFSLTFDNATVTDVIRIESGDFPSDFFSTNDEVILVPPNLPLTNTTNFLEATYQGIVSGYPEFEIDAVTWDSTTVGDPTGVWCFYLSSRGTTKTLTIGDQNTLGQIELRSTSSDSTDPRSGLLLTSAPNIYFFQYDAKTTSSGSLQPASASAQIGFDQKDGSLNFKVSGTSSAASLPKTMLYVSKSGDDARVGIGTDKPISTFEIKTQQSSSKGSPDFVLATPSSSLTTGGESARLAFVIEDTILSGSEFTISGSTGAIYSRVLSDPSTTSYQYGSLVFEVDGPTEDDKDTKGLEIGYGLNPSLGNTIASVFTGSIVLGGNVTTALPGVYINNYENKDLVYLGQDFTPSPLDFEAGQLFLYYGGNTNPPKIALRTKPGVNSYINVDADGSDISNFGIGTSSPNAKLDVVGSGIFTGSLNVSQSFTASGLYYPDTDGTDGQTLITDGSGKLEFNDIKVYARVKNISGGTLAKGTPVHASASASPPSGNVSEVIPASASVASSMPATFVLDEEITNGSEGRALLSGFINGVDTSAFNEGDVVYVGENGGYTNVKPTSDTNLIQNLGIVTKVDASNGSGFIYGSGRSNDVPNLPTGKIWVGSDSYTVTSSVISLDETNKYVSGSESAKFKLGTYAFGYNVFSGFGFDVTGSGIIVSSSLPDEHYPMVKIGETELLDLTTDTGLSDHTFTIHNVDNFQVTSGSEPTEVSTNKLFEHTGDTFKIYSKGNSTSVFTASSSSIALQGKDVSILPSSGVPYVKVPNTSTTPQYVPVFDVVPNNASGQELKYITASTFIGGNVNNTGTPAANQIAVFTDATTIEGNSGFTYDGTTLNIQANTHNLDGGDVVIEGNTTIYGDGGLETIGDITGSDVNITDFPSVSASLASAGNVSNTGTPADSQIAVFTDATTIEGTSGLTYNGTSLDIDGVTAGSGVKIYGGVVGSVNPYISPMGGHSVLNFGDASTGNILSMQNNKISFDSDAANTYIQADTDNPENLEIHADGNIELRADNSLEVYSPISTSFSITGSDVYIDEWGSVSASLAAAGGGGSPTTYRVVLQSNCYLSQADLRYLPFNSLSEQANFNYISLTPAAADGQLISITVWPQSGGGSTIAGLHVNSNATATATDTQTLSSGAPTTFTFSGATFSQNDELSFSIDPTSNPNGFSAQIILEYDY